MWQDVHRQEFKVIKEKLKHVVPLTPVNTSSALILHTDASTDGLGWILSQLRSNDNNQDVYSSPHYIIAMGSSTLSSAQKRYSPVEIEVLAISHSIHKLDFFTKYSSDCSALVSTGSLGGAES